LDAAVDAAKEALNVSHRVLARAGHTRSSGDESRAQNVAAPATAEEQK